MMSGSSFGPSADREMALADQRLLFSLFKKSNVFFEGNRIVFWAHSLHFLDLKSSALTDELRAYNLLTYADMPNADLFQGKRFRQAALALCQSKEACDKLATPEPVTKPWESEKEYFLFPLTELYLDSSGKEDL